MNRCQKAFLSAFIFVVVASWSPIKSINYAVPLIVAMWLIIFCQSGRLVRRAFILSLVWGFLISLHALLNRDFVVQNAALATITYGPVFLFLVIPSRLLGSKKLYLTVAKILLFVLLLQSSIGFVQALSGYQARGNFDISNGDRVEGTVDLPLRSLPNASNRIFATNVAFGLIALLPYAMLQRSNLTVLFVIGFASLVLVLASVVHLLLMLIVALVFSFLWISRAGRSKSNMRRRNWLVIAPIAVIVVAMFVFIPRNLRLLRQVHYQEVVVEQNNPKVVLISRLADDAQEEYPQLAYIGMGPGQFGSLASLIGTGMYFGGPSNPTTIPLLSARTTPALEEFVMDLWIQLSARNRPASSTRMPFSSWFAVYQEFGMVGIVASVLYVGYLLFSARRAAMSNYEQRIMAFALSTGIVLFVLLGAQLHYWESSQIVLIGIVSLKVLQGNLRLVTVEESKHYRPEPA